jgi:DNA polymerase-4
VADRARLHAELVGMAAGVAEQLRATGKCARTVTTKLRYDDFSIRSRSTTLGAGTDDPDTIGQLACRLLDRALEDRPGALRLVGVGVSSLEQFRQLTLV